MNDGTKLLLGPFLALVPIVAWEFWLKPARVRRNVALSILAEIDVNLGWLLELAASRTERPRAIPAAPDCRKLVLTANAQQLGELPPATAAEILELYGNLDSIVAIVSKLHQRSAEFASASTDERKRFLSDSVRRGQMSLSSHFPGTLRRAESVRKQLHAVATGTDFMDDVPPLTPFDKLVDEASLHYAKYGSKQFEASAG